MTQAERRRFERVNLPPNAEIFAVAPEGELLGQVRIIGRGGLLLKTIREFSEGERRDLVVVDSTQGIRLPVKATVRYKVSAGVGFEFETLDVESAYDLGVIVGRYYAASSAATFGLG